MEPFIFISGATGGLGSAFALDCARRGYNLFLTDRNEHGGEFAHSLREEFDIECRYSACDLTSAEARAGLYRELQESGLHFWGLINVAGLDYEGDFLGRTRQEVMSIVQLNVESTLDTTYAILNLREPQKWFRLINVCSLAAYNPMPYKAVYAASKRFLLDFSAALREEIRPFGTVTALCPAGMPTTPENMRAIFAQGFWGKVTTVDQETVARQTVDAALRGKPLCIPGWINRLIQAGSSLLPASLTVKIIESRWKNSRESQLEIKNGVPVIHRSEPKIRRLDIKLV
jgi:short-subunit dehydrogenase